MSVYMQLQTIGSSDFETKPGQYPGTFVKIEGPTEGQFGPMLTWEWRGEDGNVYKGFCDEPKTKPNPANKCGRWLAALAGQPCTMDLQVNPANYVGRRYLLIYDENPKTGKVSLQTFTLID